MNGVQWVASVLLSQHSSCASKISDFSWKLQVTSVQLLLKRRTPDDYNSPIYAAVSWMTDGQRLQSQD